MMAPTELVMFAGDKLVTDSRRVARHFGKRHDNVLRAYDKVRCSPGFNRLNFEAVEYLDTKGEKRRSIRMTKNGFIFLALGFTGAKADAIREAYILAFDEMAAALERRDLGVWQQMQALIAREAESQVRASFGSHLMLERKREIPAFDAQRAKLENEIQPPLFSQVECVDAQHRKGEAPTGTNCQGFECSESKQETSHAEI